MTRLTVDDAAKVAKDAAYVGIGLGVLAFQRAQVQRRELRRSTTDQLDDARQTIQRVVGVVDDRVRLVEERLQAVEEQVEAAVGQLESRLPGPVAEASRAARATGKAVRAQMRDLARNGRR